ncbi:hypothetical protein B0H19DRAFT_1261352 [Mycena capillaripes]|nr:hypothetical protein B0H19DRAFT_1261352 [Mycena capillaripes]
MKVTSSLGLHVIAFHTATSMCSVLYISSGPPGETAKKTSRMSDVRAVSFQLHLLPPQSRVLALCSVAYSSLSTFHPFTLGKGPRPESFLDHAFFSSSPNLLGCGARRALVYRALRSEALKAAWKIGDVGSAGRTWANSHLAHVRTLAPIWRASAYTTTDAAEWAGFLMAEGLISATILLKTNCYSTAPNCLR